MGNKVFNEFSKWLDKIIEKNDFDDVVAFNFNIYEGEGTFHVQLIGAGSFDVDDEDWACDEVFTTGENIFIISRNITGQEWQKGLSYCTELVSEYLSCGKYSEKLKDKKAVGIGFVDGDIEILYKK